jgi:hypothetical protein
LSALLEGLDWMRVYAQSLARRHPSPTRQSLAQQSPRRTPALGLGRRAPAPHAPERLHEEIDADYSDMICAATREDIETRRKAFIRKWRLKQRAVADSLEEAGDLLFTFTCLPPSLWRSAHNKSAALINLL